MPIIDERLAKYSRARLTRDCTPLDYLVHLSNRLDREIYLKRDDLTDLALGGDKPRKLEYELAVAKQHGATTLVTCGSSQSNHARLTTAAARRLGLGAVVVLSRDDYYQLQGNLLTVYLMGADVHVIDTDDHWDLEQHALDICDRQRSAGEEPYYVPVSGSTPRSCLGYIRGGLEIVDQAVELGLQLDAIYTPFGTGGTFSAILLAIRERGLECPLVGISVNRERKQCQDNLEKWWDALHDLLGNDLTRTRGEYEIDDSFVGREYGDPTEAGLDAIMLMAESEGILLDPVYSGKTCAGLLAHCAAGRWPAGTHLLMLHSGGVPALFAYHEAIQTHLTRRGRIVPR